MRANENAPEVRGAKIDPAGGPASTNQKRFAKSNSDQAALQSRFTSTEAQRAKLLALLRTGPQTTYSLRKHGLAQCAARIWELRRAGSNITTESVTAVDSDGFIHVRVARYELISEAESAEE